MRWGSPRGVALLAEAHCKRGGGLEPQRDAGARQHHLGAELELPVTLHQIGEGLMFRRLGGERGDSLRAEVRQPALP